MLRNRVTKLWASYDGLLVQYSGACVTAAEMKQVLREHDWDVYVPEPMQPACCLPWFSITVHDLNQLYIFAGRGRDIFED